MTSHTCDITYGRQEVVSNKLKGKLFKLNELLLTFDLSVTDSAPWAQVQSRLTAGSLGLITDGPDLVNPGPQTDSPLHINHLIINFPL